MYTTNSIIDKNAKPYSPDKIQNLVAQFQRDGYLFLKGVVTEKEVLTLREAMERKYQDPKMHEPEGDHIRGISMMRMFEYDINYIHSSITACQNTSGQEPTHACSGYWGGMKRGPMGKPYTIVQRDKYKLAIYRGTAPLDSDNDNVDV